LNSLAQRRLLDPAIALLLAVLAIAVFRGVFGRIFFHDDWTLLARAAGIVPHPEVPVRWLGFDGYWRFMHAIAQQNADAYAASRVVLHLATGAAVWWVAIRLAGNRIAATLAAAIYLLTPLAFEALYWASGVTELLATLGLLVACGGILRQDRVGVVVVLVGGLVSLLSKEIGWWLPLATFVVWWRHRRWEWLVVTLALTAVVAAALLWTMRVLSHDYSWSFGAVPWSLLRSGSWLVPRPRDLIDVWEAGPRTLVLGGAAWSLWLALAAWRWRRGEPWPALALAAALCCLAPSLGLRDHLVPRYLLSVQAFLALALAAWLGPRLRYTRPVIIAAAAVLTLHTSWCVDRMLTDSYQRGRPAHRLVAKELMVRIIWKQLTEAGLQPGMDLALLRRGDHDETGAEYILDVIGQTWGPRLILGADTEVMIADNPAEIHTGALTFGFVPWNLEYLGVRRGPG